MTARNSVLALHHALGVDAGDLADAEIVIGDMEILEIREQQRVGGLVVRDGRREDGLAQLVERDIGDARHAVGHAAVDGGGRRGFEHDRVGDDGRRDQTGQLCRRHEAALLIHFGDDRRGRADRLVPEVNGAAGLDVGQPMVVDDLHDLRLLEPRTDCAASL